MKIKLQSIIKNGALYLIIASSIFFVTGCATTVVPPRVEVIPISDKNASISVGDFKNSMGLGDPKKIRFNVSLNRSVSKVVQDIVIEELQREGYKIDKESPYEVTGNINSIVYGPGTTISFTLSTKLNGHHRPLFEEPFMEGTFMPIWKAESQIEQVRLCVRQFVKKVHLSLSHYKWEAKSQDKSTAPKKKIYVTDLTITQQGRDLVFEYTLTGSDSDTSDEVILEYSLDGGQTWKEPKGLFGDSGKNVSVGKNKRIIWSVLDELPAGIVGDADFRVETLEEK